MRREWIAYGTIAAWYALEIAILFPLANGAAIDGWLYGEAVRRYMQSGEIRFAGYSMAMPLLQVFYGAQWGTVFGAGPRSLAYSTVVLSAAGAMMFHALARRCGAQRIPAAIATGCLIANPCFTFLTFSFMTDVPFLSLMIASVLAFNASDSAHVRADLRAETIWIWVAAALALLDFMIRPFAALTIAGYGAAILIFDARSGDRRRIRWAPILNLSNGLIAGAAACCAVWIWLTVIQPRPWSLEETYVHFGQFFEVPIAYYLRAGVLNPIVYLGAVLSPAAIVRYAGTRRAQMFAGAVAMFAAAIALSHIDPRLPMTPEFSCFAGWDNALVLRGLPNRFIWSSAWQYAFLAIGCLGASAVITMAWEARRAMTRTSCAMVVAAGLYWLLTLPTWFFNDRYDLVMIPAAALATALAPWPKSSASRWCAATAMILMAAMSLGGVYAYQREFAETIAARDWLERSGVPRTAIDAGYPLNGEDLYRYPKRGIDSMAYEAGIPMITSARIAEYTIAAEPIAGTKVVRRIRWPGMFGFGHRYFYILKKEAKASDAPGARTPDGGANHAPGGGPGMM